MDSIARYAYDAGFRDTNLITAVAIAYAESGGNPSNYNPETAAGTPSGMGSYGLWQIYRKAHPEFTGWDLNDPATNARAAYRVWVQAGKSFRPWSTYQHGSHLKYITRAASEVAALDAAQGSTNTKSAGLSLVLALAGLVAGGALARVIAKRYVHAP